MPASKKRKKRGEPTRARNRNGPPRYKPVELDLPPPSALKVWPPKGDRPPVCSPAYGHPEMAAGLFAKTRAGRIPDGAASFPVANCAHCGLRPQMRPGAYKHSPVIYEQSPGDDIYMHHFGFPDETDYTAVIRSDSRKIPD